MKITNPHWHHFLKLLVVFVLLAALMVGCGSDSASPHQDLTPVVFTKYSTSYVPFTRYTTVYLPQVFARYTTVYIRLQNHAPTAVAGADQTVNIWDSVLLNGRNSSDPDQDFLGYTWSFLSKPSGSNANFDYQYLSAPRFTPDVPGEYRISLTVTDGKAISTPAETTITALPYAVTSNLSDSSGVITVTSSSFEYSYQTQTDTSIIIRMTIGTNDGLPHSFAVHYQALDRENNVVYSGELEGGSPNVFQTSARIKNSDYPRIHRWVIAKVERYT